MSENGNEKKGTIEEHLILYSGMPTWGQVLSMLASQAHGKTKIVVAGKKFNLGNLTVSFTCEGGHSHAFQHINTPRGPAFKTELRKWPVIRQCPDCGLHTDKNVSIEVHRDAFKCFGSHRGWIVLGEDRPESKIVLVK